MPRGSEFNSGGWDVTVIIANTYGHADCDLVRLEISVPVIRIQVVIWSPDSAASEKGGKSAQTRSGIPVFPRQSSNTKCLGV